MTYRNLRIAWSVVWHRLIRWRLSTVLLVATILSLGLGYLSYQAYCVAFLRQRIEELGGTLKLTYEVDAAGNPVDATHPVPKWLRAYIGENYFIAPYSVDLSSRRFSERDMEFLFRNGSARSIRVLDIDSGPLTDAGLEIIADLPGLISLEISYTQVSHRGVKKLCQKCPRLEYLYVFGLTLDDDTIDDLGSLSGLKVIAIHLDRSGVIRLQKKLPECRICTNSQELYLQ